MNLAILHYHLNRGGVTRVIENHLLALDVVATEPIRAAILFGGRAEGWPADLASRLRNVELSLHAVPELDYDEQRRPEPERLSTALRAAFAGIGFGPSDSILHVHNHSLGKNVSLPTALRGLAAEGWRLLLQIHDFAEDFRPANFRRIAAAFGDSYTETLYPQASQIHYAVLNERDRGLLAAAGVPQTRLRLLPNPVLGFGTLPDRDTARSKLEQQFGIGTDSQFVLYPVRGIRRKNVGELLLLSLLDDGATYGLSLVPVNPLEKLYHDRWQTLAETLHLPVRFATGEPAEDGLTFLENLAAADAVVTTSVAEGFGMTFLEPWLAGKPLLGRDLPEITADFKSAGIRFDGLYERLAVPLEWVESDRYADALRTAGEALLEAYGRPPLPMRTWLAVFLRKTEGGTVDFGDLDEELQETVIRRVAENDSARGDLRSLNPGLFSAAGDAPMVTANAERVRSEFAPEPIGRHLADAYECLMNSDIGAVGGLEAHDVLLDRLLDLDRFRLIRGAV